ncbi:polysaccharide deacetylase family protein [uncultured Clostridium sp.]|uniref:polysaccharide deacetylase family protein n=1 Tax=uncultured Clostridium sp. TaxID=59620 RepID=UPI0028E65577|nr:polysaccharide deacetylase family protein [uncultured Clostridium sp.]
MKSFKKVLIFVLIILTVIIMTPYECKAMYSGRACISNETECSEFIHKNIFSEEIPLKYNDEGVCVLMYHSIGYEKNNGLRMPEQQFREQMKYIKDNGYTTLTMDELYSFFTENKPIPKKSLVITFDDGYLDNYKYAYPILKEFDLKATIFVIASNIDKDNRSMNSQQLKELQANGIDIQSHTLNHEELNKLSYEKQLQTLKESKEIIEKALDKKVNYIAYPYGRYNEDTIRAVKDAGYTMGFATGGRVSRKNNGIYTLRRIGVVAGDEMSVFIGKLKSQ